MRPGERRWTAILLAGAMALAGCGETGSEGESGSDGTAGVPEAERSGGTAVVGAQGEVPTLNPLAIADHAADQLARYAVFTTLLRYDEELRPRPYLAESWELDADSTRLTFRLRDDVSWHDGEPVTAEDVAFTFRRATNPEVGYRMASYFGSYDSVEVVGPHTVRFRVEPTAGYLFAWVGTPIVPEHVLGDVPPSELSSHPFGTRELVGSGPYRFVEREAGDRWIFEANRDFPEALGGPPHLDRLVYRVIPEPSTLLAELRTGGVHLYMRALPDHLERLRESPDVELRTAVQPSFGAIGWNTRRPLFEDAGVRRALLMALDREELVEVARNGLGVPATGPMGPWHWAYDTTRNAMPHAPDSARALLEAAGWSDGDGDGVRERDGREFRFQLATNQRPIWQDVAVMIQSQLRSVGVAAEPRVREYASLAQTLTSPERDFDAVLLALSMDLVVDDRSLWSCARRGTPMQFSGFCDPEMDALMDSIPRVLDRERRRRILRRYDEAIYERLPMGFLYYEEQAHGVRRGLEGVRLDARGELVSIRDWWLRPEAR